MSDRASTGPAARILVVDGDPDICDLLAQFLTGEGHAVSVAPDGHRALGRAMEEFPDLVLTDVALPGIRGPELYALLRRRGFPGPVVLMTAHRLQAAALAAHPAPVVRKPFDFGALRATIDRALAPWPRPTRHGSRAPDERPARVLSRLVAQPDAMLAETADAAARRLREPGLGQDELGRLIMERVLAEGLLHDRQSRCRTRRDAESPMPD